jgi:general stress protein YciG
MTNEQEKDTSKRGFASMPSEQVQEIASKGGHASAEKAGHEGMAARGRQGGEATAQRAGREGMSEHGARGEQSSGSSSSSASEGEGEEEE